MTKKYPLFARSIEHDHPYAIAASRIHTLECENKRLLDENTRLNTENASLRKLALHGLIYRLDHLMNMELAKEYPNPGRIRRLMDTRIRFNIAYEKIKKGRE